MLRTVRSAIKHNVKIGAHPGLDDIKGFGRRAFAVSEEEVYALALYQIGALKAIVEAEGGKLSHVKVCQACNPKKNKKKSINGDRFMGRYTSSFEITLPFSAHSSKPKYRSLRTLHSLSLVSPVHLMKRYPKKWACLSFLSCFVISTTISRKLLSVPESRAPTEALIRERLARVLTKGESKLEFIYSTYGEAWLMNPFKHLTMTITHSNYLS